MTTWAAHRPGRAIDSSAPNRSVSDTTVRPEGSSGSGSTTFAVVRNLSAAQTLAEAFKQKFGQTHWTALVAA